MKYVLSQAGFIIVFLFVSVSFGSELKKYATEKGIEKEALKEVPTGESDEPSLADRPSLVDAPPFWREKPHLFDRIKRRRAIIVSVRSHKLETESGHELRMQGGGMISVPKDFAYEHSKDLEVLKKTGNYVKELNLDKETGRLFLHTAAFRYHAKMHMQVSYKENHDKSPEKSVIQFEIVRGTFQGMKGEFNFEEYNGGRTIIGFNSLYNYEELPIPRFFVRFGLEVVIQKMSERIRSVIESEYKKSIQQTSKSE